MKLNIMLILLSGMWVNLNIVKFSADEWKRLKLYVDAKEDYR